jgi:hypothetical protein
LRSRFVKVGGHIPPRHEALDSFLERFAFFYDPAKKHGVRPLVALAAAHPVDVDPSFPQRQRARGAALHRRLFPPQ